MGKIKYSVVVKNFSPLLLGVYIRCEQFSKSIDIDTDVHIFHDEWDESQQLVVNNPNKKKLNLFIRKTLYQLEEYELDYDGDFTLSKLKTIWEGRSATHDFYKFMKMQIDTRDIRDSTRDIHRRVLKHLIEYQEECLLSELTEDFVKGWQRFMKTKPLNPATVCMELRAFRCYYNLARKTFGDKVPSDSFAFYHETQEQQTSFKMKPLSDDDVRLIENYVAMPTTPQRYVYTLEQFLFMIYTGVRISDFVSIQKNSLTMEDGKMWLTYTSQKTNTFVRVPISYIFDGRAEQIINKHLSDFDTFFHFDKKLFNPRIKVACKHAGITKPVSAHIARHTCASRLVNKDVPITTIQKVIGHRTLRMTMVYAKTNESTLTRQLS